MVFAFIFVLNLKKEYTEDSNQILSDFSANDLSLSTGRATIMSFTPNAHDFDSILLFAKRAQAYINIDSILLFCLK